MCTVLAGKYLPIAKTSPKMAKLHNFNRLAKFEKKNISHSALINMLQKLIKFIDFIFISLLKGRSRSIQDFKYKNNRYLGVLWHSWQCILKSYFLRSSRAWLKPSIKNLKSAKYSPYRNVLYIVFSSFHDLWSMRAEAWKLGNLGVKWPSGKNFPAPTVYEPKHYYTGMETALLQIKRFI